MRNRRGHDVLSRRGREDGRICWEMISSLLPRIKTFIKSEQAGQTKNKSRLKNEWRIERERERGWERGESA